MADFEHRRASTDEIVFDHELVHATCFGDCDGEAQSTVTGGNAANGFSYEWSGGTGIFTGRPAYVWISNQIGNTGVLTGFDVLDAAIKGDPAWVPDDVTFRMNYRALLQPFGGLPATLMTCTIPDPADTAYFTPVHAAPRVAALSPSSEVEVGSAA